MIVKTQKNVIDLIGETAPYLFENADKIVFDQSITEISLYKSFECFEKENLVDLIKILSTLGSLSLVSEIKKEERNYFLGEKLRIRRISYHKPSGMLTAKVTSLLENNRKGRALIDVVNDQTKLFQMEMDYYIIDEISFKQMFASHYNTEKYNNLIKALPYTSFEFLSENEFNITINAFSRNHCCGHFDNFEIVPAVFVGKCILKKIFEMFPDIVSEVDSLEVFLNNAMPINTVFNVNVKTTQLLRNLRNYHCTITDCKTHYGYFFATLKN